MLGDMGAEGWGDSYNFMSVQRLPLIVEQLNIA